MPYAVGWTPMAPRDLARGWLTGVDPEAPSLPTERASPRRVLERRAGELLQDGPVLVAFSGGRDSSLLLAVLALVARREGLPPPRALTMTYPDVPEADEERWQQLVLRHLDVEVVRLTVTTGSDLVGPDVLPYLRRHGVCFPPGMYVRLPALRAAAGATLVTGEGGDEVLAVRRVTPVARLTRGRRPARHHTPTVLAQAVAPWRLRRRLLHRIDGPDAGAAAPWLRRPEQAAFAADVAADRAREPLHHAAATARLVRRRAHTVGMRHLDLLARECDVRLRHPLVEPAFVAAVQRHNGALGRDWLSRTEVLLSLAGDLLPEELLRRPTKAAFNGAAVSVHARAFAEQWDGSGVDTDLVDPAALRREWLADAPHAGSLALLQAARLAAP